MRLVVAQGALLDAILDQTFPIWHEGLDRSSYGRWYYGQLRTAWGRTHLERFALLADDGRLLASAKRYRYRVRMDGSECWMCGLGAVFTPPDLRGRGYASTLIERLLDQERREGVAFAALFSEIGPDFYRRHGFDVVPFQEVTVNVRRKPGSPAMLVRAGEERDLPVLADMHDVRSRPARFALRRDPPVIQYALAKKRLLAGLGPLGLRQIEFFVAEEGASAVAYVILSVGSRGWTLEEAGDRDPSAARLGALLQAMIAREPTHEMPLIRAWWPAALPVPPQVELTDRTDALDLFMVKPLADVAVPSRTEDVFYWRSDYF